jgi:arginine decarboxylase-like protein
MKTFLIIAISLYTHTAFSQVYVYHPDLMREETRNIATQNVNLVAYNNVLEKVKQSRQKITEYSTVIEGVHARIFSHLTNASYGIRNSVNVVHAAQKSTRIYSNIQQIFQLAANKPYAIPCVTRFAQVVVNRVVKLMADINMIAHTSGEDFISHPAERDRMLADIASNLNSIVAMTDGMVAVLKRAGFRDVIQTLMPSVTQAMTQDTYLAQQILWRFRQFGHL